MSRMVATDDAAERETLLMRGALDLCVLALLDQEAAHAYGLVQQLIDQGFEQSSYGTVYPLVTRLRRQGLVVRRSEASPGGPARNMLSLTPDGRAALERWGAHWRHTTARVESVITRQSSTSPQGETHTV